VMEHGEKSSQAACEEEWCRRRVDWGKKIGECDTYS